MFQKVSFEEAAGKTVKAIRNTDEGVIVSLTDETFSVIKADACFEGAEIDLEGYFNPLDHRLDLVLEPLFGDMAKTMHSEALEKSKRDREARDQQNKGKRRKQYEKLKSEFENEDDQQNNSRSDTQARTAK